MWSGSLLPSCSELLVSPAPAHDLISTEHDFHHLPPFPHTSPPSIHTSPIFSCSLPSRRLWRWPPTPAGALSSLLWPFPQQCVHLWLHWPLPIAPPLMSAPTGTDRGQQILCASMQREIQQMTGGKWKQKKRKQQLHPEIAAGVKGEGTSGFGE